MKIILGRQIEEVKKKDSENEKNLLKNRNSDELNELDENEDDIYFHSGTIKNLKIGSYTVNRVYLNNSIVYELQDTVDLNLFHSLVPAATATSILFDKIENQNISNYNFIGYCDANNHIAVYNNNTEYLVLNIRNAVSYSPNVSSNFFSYYTVLNNCVFRNFNTQNVTTMSGMFLYCRGLTSLDLSSFNTQNVINTQGMFYACSSLTSLDLSNFNTQNVITMFEMFLYCRGLTSLDLSSFNTQNVSNTDNMFFSCSSLTTIISNTFNKTALNSSSNMFLRCTAIVGGNGTTYSDSHTNAEYARVDGENGLPGYFTAPAANK